MTQRFTFIILVASLYLIISAPLTFAYTLTTTGSNNGYGLYQAGQGGEFTFQAGDGLEWVLGNYSGKAKNIGGTTNTFQSFCLEMHEYLYGNTRYDVTLNTAAVYGGGPDHGAVDGKDPISVGTAWLYYNFAKGTLAGYMYDSGETAREASALALQKAIWYLEGEITDSEFTGSSFYDAAFSMFGSYVNKDNGIVTEDQRKLYFPVMVANLWVPGHVGQDGYQRQDQLVVTPIPSALYLLGAGLMGLVGIRRRMQD